MLRPIALLSPLLAASPAPAPLGTVSMVSHILAALAAGGVIGLADQYLALFLVGLAVNVGWITPIGQAAFVAEAWFLLVVAGAYVLTNLPSWLHHSFAATVVNAISGPISVVSAAVMALAAAGVIASARPEFAAAMYLLSRDARWTQFDAYQTGDWAVLMGGGLLGGGLTMMKFLAKPGINVKTGQFLSTAPPFWVAVESLASVTLTPAVLFLERADPRVVTGLMALAAAGMAALLVISVRWLVRARRRVGQVWGLLKDSPADGLAIVAELVVPGSGWFMRGQRARAAVLLAVWGVLVLLAFTVVGLLVAVPAHLFLATRSAAALFREVSSAAGDSDSAPPPVAGDPVRVTAGAAAGRTTG